MQTYLVGGAVRDELLERPVKERDWVVVGTTAKHMSEQGFTQVGKDFPVFLHPQTNEEYALARTERKAGKGYTGFICHADPGVTLEQDLIRRDLTINAIAKSKEGKLIDPYHGMADLKQKKLRHISPAFSEDPLRVFRVARFAARYAYLGFSVADETLGLMKQMSDSGELHHLSAERVWKETVRSLSEDTPSVYFSVLKKVNALSYWFAEFDTKWTDLVPIIEKSERQTSSPSQRWACLCAICPIDAISALNSRLKTPSAFADLALLTARHWQHAIRPPQADSLLTLFNACDAWRKPARFDAFLSVCAILAPYQEKQRDYNHTMSQALHAANQVDAKKYVSEGLKGPAIKAALDKEKIHRIDELLTQQS